MLKTVVRTYQKVAYLSVKSTAEEVNIVFFLFKGDVNESPVE